MTEEIENFIDKIVDITETINNSVSDLRNDTDNNAEEFLNLLFRKIHSLKAIAYYLEYDEIAELIEKTEDIVSFVKTHKCCVKEAVYDWIINFGEQIEVWKDDLENNVEISLYNRVFNSSPRVKCKYYTSSAIIEHYKIVILHNDAKVLSILEKILIKKFKFVHIANTVAEAERIMLTPGNKFLISDFKFSDGNIINLMQKLQDRIDKGRLIIVSNFNNKHQIDIIKDKLKLNNIFDSTSTKLSDIKQICVDYIEPSGNELIEIPTNTNKMTLTELSRSIKPLPKIVNELKTACFESDKSIKEITDIVEKDPVLVGLILKRINSPFTGLSNEVTRVGLAVSLLGKKQLGAMALVQLRKELSDSTDLNVYNIKIENMMDMMDIRTKFLKQWMKDLGLNNDRQDEILTISLLMPLSMILMNKSIEYNNQEKKFNKLLATNKNVYSLEEEIVGFDRFSALAMLMDVWNLPSNLKRIVNTIRTPSIDHNKNIQTEALILYISLKVFKHDGNFMITTDILKFIHNHNLNAVSFKNIFLKITNGVPKGTFFN